MAIKKKLGRPRRIKGTISFWNFQRAGIVMSLFDEVRKKDQKRNCAIAQTVELIKQRNPELRISETEVKRILAAWRPKGSHTILHLECVMPNQEQLAKQSDPLATVPSKTVTVYRMSFDERPNYPRFNRKSPKA